MVLGTVTENCGPDVIIRLPGGYGLQVARTALETSAGACVLRKDAKVKRVLPPHQNGEYTAVFVPVEIMLQMAAHMSGAD